MARRTKKPEWKLVTTYDVRRYECGLEAGDQLVLIQPIVVKDYTGLPTGEVHEVGLIWTVRSGSRDDPGVVWLREPNGDRHTWDDNASIFEWFKRMDGAEGAPPSA